MPKHPLTRSDPTAYQQGHPLGLMLFVSPDVDEVAQALLAQDGSRLYVYVNSNGFGDQLIEGQSAALKRHSGG